MPFSLSYAQGGVLASVNSAGRWLAGTVSPSASGRAPRLRASHHQFARRLGFGVTRSVSGGGAVLASALFGEQHLGG